MVLILMQDDRDIWLCCFSSSAHKALNFHPLLMLYSFRRPPELLQVTQKHTSATTEYAQRVKGRQMSKKTMFKLNTTAGLSGLFTLFFSTHTFNSSNSLKTSCSLPHHQDYNTVLIVNKEIIRDNKLNHYIKSSLSNWHVLFYFCLVVDLDCISRGQRQMNREQDAMDIWEYTAPHRLYIVYSLYIHL